VDHVHGSELCEYWEERGRSGSGSAGDIDWEASGRAMVNAQRSRRQWVRKHGSGFCATGKMMFQWKKRDTAKCPQCEEDEDTLHVWKCRGEGVDQVWEKAIAGLNR